MTNNNNETIDSWLKWLTRLAICGAIVTAVMIGFYFWYTWGPISRKQSDWAALGSFFSGIFAFLGAIGTIGVMLLAVNQFKIQQIQILEQSKKQADFEVKQLDKWAEEARILKFQLYLSHQKQFEDMLLEFEASSRFRVNKRILYKKVFPNNNSNYVSFKSETGGNGVCFIVELNDEFTALHDAAFNPNMDYYKPENLVLKLKKILKKLSLFCVESAIIGDIKDIDGFNKNTGINIFNIYETINSIKSLMDSINSFGESPIVATANSIELVVSYKLELYYLSHPDAIYTTPTVKGLIELAELQVEFKKHIYKGLPFDFDIFHNKTKMDSTLEQWDRMIERLYIAEDELKKIKDMKKSFVSAYEYNSVDEYLTNSRRLSR